MTGHFPDVAGALTDLATKKKAVLDGELVIWNAGRFDFAALQDRLRSGPRRAHTLAAAMPAAFVVFDLLAQGRADLRDLPYQHRRAALEALLARGLPDGLVLTPSTLDAAVARSWLTGHGAAGIEGVVAKRLDQPYRPGVRGWQKLRSRLTAEAVVGGVIGPLNAPRVLLLGRHDTDGHLHLVGRTTELTPAGRAVVAPLLRPSARSGHPWSNPLPSTRWGRPGPPTAYTPVRPGVVVEVTVDTAVEHHRWRHPARFLRVRADLGSDDLTPLPPIPASPPNRGGSRPGSGGGNRPAHRVDGGRCGAPRRP
jgi:ATP-dependent DNA ligase